MTPDAVPVALEASEVRHAALVGISRHLAALSQGRRNPDLTRTDAAWQCDIEGALGELAVAKALGVFWEPNVGGNDKNDGDVAGWHVRATARPAGSLIIHNRDPDDALFVLVTGEPPCLHIRGWLYGHEAKQTHYWRNAASNGAPLPRPAYFVPADDLMPWDSRPFR